MTATRRLAAILAADVAGYSRLIGAEENGTCVSGRVRADAVGKVDVAFDDLGLLAPDGNTRRVDA